MGSQLSDYFASAFVRVKADPKQLRADLEKLKESIAKQVFRVQVRADARGFKAQLQEQVTKTPIAIPVKPDTRGFRAKMLEQLKGLAVPVEVIPTAPAKVSAAARAAALAATPAAPAGAAGAAGQAAGATAALTKEEQRLAAVQAQLIETQLAFDAALEEGLTLDQQKARLQEAVSLSTRTTAAASKELAAAYTAESAALISTLEPLRERAALQRLEIEAAVTRGAGAATANASAESELTAAQTARARVVEQLRIAELRYEATLNEELSVEQRLRTSHTALGAANKAQTVSIQELAAAYAVGNTELIASLTPLAERAKLSVIDADAAVAAAEGEAARVAAITEGNAAITAANIALQTNAKFLTSKAELTALESSLNEAAAGLESAKTAAIEASNTALAQQITELEGLVAASQAAVISQRELLAATAKTAAAEELAARGFFATGLAALGARGATLAASGEFLVGAAAATAFFKAVSSAAQLQKELNVFQVTAGATADQMEQVSAAARELGNDITLPAVSASDAAQAMTELAKAGLSVQDSLDGTRGVLQLATAAEIDNAEATELVASALNAFGLAGTDAVRVADLLTGSAIESQGSISDMGIALQQSAAAARQAGLSVEDTVALLTLLARNGLKGSDAGTSLRTALIRLINPTDKAAKAIDELGLRIRDSEGNVRPEVFADMGTALGQLGAKQRDATLALIFGQDAFRSAAIFAREGALGLDQMREATQKQGLTAQIAGAQTRGFAGDVEALKNSLSTLGVAFGELTLGPLSAFVQGLADGTVRIQEFLAIAEKVGKVDLADLLPAGPDALKTGVTFGEILGKGIEEGIGIALTAQFLGPTGVIVSQLSRLTSTIGENFDTQINDKIKEITDNASIFATVLQGITRKGGLSSAVEEVQKLRDQVKGSSQEAKDLRALLDGVIRVLTGLGRAPTALELQVFFDKGFVSTQFDDIRNIIKQQPPIEFDLTLNQRKAKAEAEAAARESANAVKTSFGDVLTPAVGAAIGIDFATGMLDGIDQTLKERTPQIAADFTASLSSQLLAAQAAGNLQSQLNILNQQLANAQARLARAQAGQKAALKRGETGKGFQETIDAVNKQIIDIKNQIEQVSGEIESNSKAAADKLEKARNEADQHFLDTLGVERRKRENAVLRAAATAGLADDISAQRDLRDFIKRSRDEAQKTLKDAKTKAATVGQLTTDLIQANQRLDELNKQLQDSLQQRFEIQVDIARATGNVTRLRKLFAERLRQLRAALADAKKGSLIALQLRQQIVKTQQDAFDAINESFELDISFAETTGNKAREIKARKALIKQLQREQAQVKKGTLEWKRLRNQIAEQRKAIEEVDQENKKFFQQASFAFLTTEQGFAANLLGNLLPMGAIGSTVANKLAVGGSTAPSGSDTTSGGNFTTGPNVILPQEHGRGRVPPGQAKNAVNNALGTAPAAGGPAGPTRGQQSVELDLLRKILRAIEALHSATKHPEAKTRSRQNNAAMDVHEHGIGGGG